MHNSRLLIFHPALAPYRVDFFNALGKEFKCQVVFLTKNNINQNFDQNNLLKDRTFNVSYLKKHFLIFQRNFNIGYWEKLKNSDADIVICNEYGLSLISTYIFKITHNKKYKIYTLCDDSLDITLNVRGVRKLLRKFFIKRINGIITVNNQVQDIYLKQLSANRVLFFPIFYDDISYRKKISNSINISNNFIDKYHLSGYKILLYVGRITKVKNLASLLIALSKLDNKILDKTKLVLVGDGEEAKYLKNLSTSLGIEKHVIFAGRYEGNELIAWYPIASHLILPSNYEPFGAVVSEALQAGTKCIVSQYAGSSCLINENNGVVFDPQNIRAFTNILYKTLINAPVAEKISIIKDSLCPISFSDKINELIHFLYND